jgi:hypothetical protein
MGGTNGIKLTSRIYQVTAIKKTTKAKHFSDIEVGDRLQFSMYMGNAGRGRGTYASNAQVDNLTKGTSDFSKSQTEASKILGSCFDTEIVGIDYGGIIKG